MSKSDLIERLNALHFQRVATFNKAAPAEQLRLARDLSFWRVPDCCSRFTYDGVCLECGRRRARSLSSSRRAVVSP